MVGVTVVAVALPGQAEGSRRSGRAALSSLVRLHAPLFDMSLALDSPDFSDLYATRTGSIAN